MTHLTSTTKTIASLELHCPPRAAFHRGTQKTAKSVGCRRNALNFLCLKPAPCLVVPKISRPGLVQKHGRLPQAVVGEGEASEEGNSDKTILTIPTILTLARVVAVPVLAAGFFWRASVSSQFCAAVFVLASITDWLDGFLARKLNVISSFGAFLDPVADKLMVATTLILLSSQPISVGHLQGNSWIIPALSTLIIGRELTMASLREWAASVSTEAYKSVAVSDWGKWKTASQMTALVLLLFACGSTEASMSLVMDTGIALLSIAAFLTVWSLTLYFKGVWKYL